MQRQRGELVPIGDALADLGGPVKAIRDATPQAVHHFTRFDQVNQLVSASEADPDLGFMARLLALCSLPRTNPGTRKEYKRVNGPFTLYMTAIGDNKLPFGNFPRLLMAWVSTEAVRTQSRVLILGPSLAKFMKTLGVYSSGGGREQIKLRNQMKRLFNAHIQLLYEDQHGEATVNAVIARRTEFWWNERKPDQPSLWDSKIELSEDFFNEIINHPVPLDMNTLTALKRCSLGLDLYLWLVYRTFPLRAPLRLSWQQVYRQFGPNPNSAATHDAVQNFRRRILREMKKIKLAWPGLNYATAPGVFQPKSPGAWRRPAALGGDRRRDPAEEPWCLAATGGEIQPKSPGAWRRPAARSSRRALVLGGDRRRGPIAVASRLLRSFGSSKPPRAPGTRR